MLQDVKEKGIPKSYCGDTKHYQTCTFVVGEFFSIFPITIFWDKVMKALQDVLTNPIVAVSTLAGCLCGGCPGVPAPDLCKPAPGYGIWYAGCIVTKTAAKIADATASIAQMGKTGTKEYWQTSNDWCEQMEKINDRRGQQEEATGLTTAP